MSAEAVTAGAEVSPLAAYAQGLGGATDSSAGSYRLRCDDGTLLSIPIERWVAPASPAERRLLAMVSGPVIDLGCGPGRHLHALRARRVSALGVDISPVAVRLARAGGAAAIRGSIFGPLPQEGSWRTGLLLDGNIGIGADPTRLLSRARKLLAPAGELLVELDGPGAPNRVLRARLEGPGVSSAWFRWSRTGVDSITPLAHRAGLELVISWEDQARWFARLAAGSRSGAGRPAGRPHSRRPRSPALAERVREG
ncbi:MAG: hypothetical protein NVSMB25_02400 [Thermoleophilaceae bacterium]